MIPKMDYHAAEKRARAKEAVRAFHDQSLVESFRFHGLSLAEMDRAELLGVISFLAMADGYMRTVKLDDQE